jgi:hypothetical protein
LFKLFNGCVEADVSEDVSEVGEFDESTLGYFVEGKSSLLLVKVFRNDFLPIFKGKKYYKNVQSPFYNLTCNYFSV